MRTHTRLLFAGSLLAGAVALGCQAPPPTQPGARAPRVVHQVGTLQLTPDTNLALQFEQPCADGVPTYALKALDTRIDEIDVTIVGPSHPAPGLTQTITRAQFNDGCSMSKLFENLFPGQYTVTMKGYKLNATPGGPRIPTMRSEASQSVTVGTETVETVVLQCDFTTGAVNVELNCCPATPTPAPTATPTPQPSGPAELTDAHIGGTTGFSVDDLGRVYVFGFDPGKTFSNLVADDFTGSEGRVVRATGPQVEATWYEDTSPILEADSTITVDGQGQVLDRKLIAMAANLRWAGTWNGEAITLDLETPAQSVKATVENARPHPPYAATTIDGEGNLYWGWTIRDHGPNAFAYSIYKANYPAFNASPAVAVQSAYHDPVTGWDGGFMPYAMTWDATGATPGLVYSCGNGIVRALGPNVNSLPQIEVAGPAFGMIKLDTYGQGFMFSRYNGADRNVYYAPIRGTASVPSTASVACTFDYGLPWRIERGLDGFVYVLLQGENNVGNQNECYQYRIVKTRLNPDNTLTPLAVVVNKLPAGTPDSFVPVSED